MTKPMGRLMQETLWYAKHYFSTMFYGFEIYLIYVFSTYWNYLVRNYISNAYLLEKSSFIIVKFWIFLSIIKCYLMHWKWVNSFKCKRLRLTHARKQRNKNKNAVKCNENKSKYSLMPFYITHRGLTFKPQVFVKIANESGI